MNQLTQKLKNGKMQIVEVPLPCLQHGQILVKNLYSLISAGTETSTLKTARKGYIGKAKERPQQVKQVVDTLKTQGITQTYRAVMKKLDAYSPLGYSCAGEVIGMGSDVKGFCVGDVVACGGFTASHAEAVCVPENLCVKLRPDTDLKQAAYNTLGAIALQGVRQADLRLGETCAIIGMGLLGQLTALLLRASGVRTVGIDIDPVMIDIAEKHCLDLALHREKIGIKKKILRFTEDLGCDAVIITAASGSLDPINFAGAISRKRSTVVVVGAVPTGFDREPHFYKKELQVKMSCSYGPGRYDPIYEDKGIDYPPAYVRWTENRNMHAFQELIYSQKIDASYLTTHAFKLDEAPAAYDLIMAKSEPFIGILIEYDVSKEIDKNNTKITVRPSASSLEPSAVNIGFIGAGSYAQSHLLPNIPKNKKVSLRGVMTATSASSRSVAKRYGFEFCTGNEKDILEDENINTIFIATRHDSHAEFVLKALKAGKHVFVEKPLCLTAEELSQIVDLLNRQTDISNGNSTQQLDNSTNHPILMVGYNRRFSPLAQRMKEAFGTGPMSMLYRINAGYISADTWIQDTEFGGGRIIGEVCHFVDFLTFMNGSPPISVYAAAMTYPSNSNDTLNVSLRYENGSIGTISYFANGDKSMPKEKIEIFTNGCIAVLDDFKTLAIHSDGRKKGKKLLSQDKGQKTEVKQFIEAILNGTGEVIPFKDIHSSSLVTFKIIESIRSGECLRI
jgi:polar amino acid transport system substrate-binding protein